MHKIPCTEFKYPEEEEEKTLQELKIEIGQKVLNDILEFLYPKRASVSAVTLRVYALIFLLRNNWLGSSPTQEDVATKILGCSKANFNKYISQAREKWGGLVIAGLRSDESREKFAECAKRNSETLADARRKAAAERREIRETF